ncbi:GNAT family N-acetyltransferase [Gorillibacterium timonense]|uniref:GNAT family N-acetyltransferase n=1 Tax=Gorillibacterium timonense TaxID=1689269 RepID=UPI00131BA9B9|nr:GNAT family N-acetyltransferase [Gorillibacterium timonense]
MIRLNQPVIRTEGFLWGRWEWVNSLPYFEKEHLNRIGIWEDDGVIVALATYEQGLGNAWLLLDPNYSELKRDMLLYAKACLNRDGLISVLIPDTDRELQDIAADEGFIPTDEGEKNAVIPIDVSRLTYALPEGYRIVSLADEFDLHKYNQVLWRGFNHQGDAPDTPDSLEGRRVELSGPHVQLELKVAVAAPNGNFVSYCGMWHLPGTDYALVEPVATDPDYRRMGLGRAAVLEGVRRCGALGAIRAYVGSSQPFYYSIGFRPHSTDTWWKWSK